MTEKREANAWESTYGSLGINTGPRLMKVPYNMLDPWTTPDGKPQIFRPYAQEDLEALAESIREYGILEALHVRPRNGRFQILAGHNRWTAAGMAGKNELPAIVEEMDDIQAENVLIESNLKHRKKLLPSEKAWAYRRQLELLNNQGQRTDLTSCQLGTKLRSNEAVARATGDSPRQVSRYARLTYLTPVLLDAVDAGRIGINPGVDLSYLPEETQGLLIFVMADNGIKRISGAQAKELRSAGNPNRKFMENILGLGENEMRPVDFSIQPDMSGFPRDVVLRLRKDTTYLAAIQQQISEYTEQYIREQAML